MKVKSPNEWLSLNARRIERFPGKWVAFSLQEGLVVRGRSLREALMRAKRKCPENPFVFHMPSRAELGRLSRKR